MSMNPETADAIRIADKHLAGEFVERRKALAHEINEAIIRHSAIIAEETIAQVFKLAREQRR
jgi:hypothetical protein